MTLRLPRYITPKVLADGTTGFYFNVSTRYRKLGCTFPNEPLGTDYDILSAPLILPKLAD